MFCAPWKQGKIREFQNVQLLDTLILGFVPKNDEEKRIWSIKDKENFQMALKKMKIYKIALKKMKISKIALKKMKISKFH